MSEDGPQRRLVALLAADVVGYSRLMGADEEGALAALTRVIKVVIEPCIASHRGRIFNSTGDGLLVEFASAVDAVRCALALQEQVRLHNAGQPSSRRIVYRIGVNLGDVIVQDGDIFGDGVNVAARLESICGPGEIYVSAAAHDQVAGKIGAEFDDLGPRSLKNITRPVRVYRVRAIGHAPPSTAPAAEPPALPDKPSIAVLPFEFYPTDAEQEAFANGMTEDLTTDLSKVGGLLVIARNSAQSIREHASNLSQIAEALGVRYLLEGSVRKAGAQARINAQLIDALNGAHLWANRFDGSIENVFELQDAVCAAVVDALSVELSQREKENLGTVHTDNLEAYELFVRAKAAPYPPIPPRIQAARDMFATVIEKAPNFAGGHAGLAAMTAFGALFSHSSVTQAASQAETIARHAIDLDATFAWSYTALGMALLLQRKYEEAVAAAHQTIELQPNDADGYVFLGLFTALAGDIAAGCRRVEDAIRLNPCFFAGPYWNVLGLLNALAGNFHAALEALDTNVRQHGPVGPPAYCSRAVALMGLGRTIEAREVVAVMMERHPEFRLTGWNIVEVVRSQEMRDQYRQPLLEAGVPA